MNGNNHSTIAMDTTTTGLLQNTTNNSAGTNTAAAAAAATNSEPNNDELLRFTSSNLIERILGRLRWRREQSNTHNNNNAHNNATNNEDGILAKSNKRAVSLLRATGWFGSGKSTNSTTGLMSDTPTKNHLQNGITCSDSGKYHDYLSQAHKYTNTLSLPLSLSLSLSRFIQSLLVAHPNSKSTATNV